MGGRERRQDGIIYSCCEIADRIYRRQRKWAIGRREKEALDGRDVASGFFVSLFFDFFSVFFPLDAAVLEHFLPADISFRVSEEICVVVANARPQLLSILDEHMAATQGVH